MAMLQVNSTLIVQIGNFLLLIWILNKILFRPFLELVERRREETEGARKKAEAMMDHAESNRAAYQAGITSATVEAAALIDHQRKAGREEREQIINQARTSSAAYLEAARSELQKDMEEARRQIEGLSRALAGEITRKILGRDTQ